MSSAHGAGLMLLAVRYVRFGEADPRDGDGDADARRSSGIHTALLGWLMVGVHTLGYVLTATAIALIVYLKVGVRFLRTGWVNLDLVWAAALILTGLIALALP